MAVRTVSNTGGNWNALTTWVGGVVPVSSDTVDFTALSGNLVVNVTTAALAGINFTNYVGTITFNANIQVNTSVNLGTGGYTQAGGGTFGLTINSTTTITSNGVSWNNLLSFTGNGVTYTLADNLNVTGNIVLAGTSSITFTGNILYINGNLTVSSTATNLGTTTFNFNGTGTWSCPSVGQIRNNITIDTLGTLTVSGNVYYQTGTLTYIAGTVVSTGSVLNLTASTTINTSGMTWREISITTGTQTLISDLNSEVLRMNNSVTVNVDSSGGNVYILESLIKSGVGISQGTASINLIGTGTWTHTAVGVIRNNININTTGTLTIGTNVYYGVGTLTYLSGKINAKNSTFNISASATLINCHKINFDNIRVNQGSIVTMNEFFSGSPSLVTNIVSNGTNYTIAFEDGFEKIAKFIDISSCTLSKPLQLLVLTKSKRSSTNIGIRYINQSPNGIAKNQPSVNQTTFGVGGLLADPINL
jgi:hypothetical protein